MNHSTLLTDQDSHSGVLLIDGDGVNHGSVSVKTAMKMAQEAGLDPVLVSQGDTPVCRLMDFSKAEYQRRRKEKESKKNQKAQKLKEIRMNHSIGEKDLDVKVKKITEFLNKGHRVKISIRGKDIRNRMQAQEKLSEFMNKVRSLVRSPHREDGPGQMGNWDYTLNIAPTKETSECASTESACLVDNDK